MAKKARKKAARKRTRSTAKKTTRKATHSRPDTVKWAAQQMNKNPSASMTDLKKLGNAAGYHVYPLIIGLARKELGWSRPKKKAQARGGARRGPGRPRKMDNPATAIQAVITRMNDLEREATALRAALGKIADIASRA